MNHLYTLFYLVVNFFLKIKVVVHLHKQLCRFSNKSYVLIL